MGKAKRRFVAQAEPGTGWRVWDNKAKKFWGERFRLRPDALIDELNGARRSEELVRLARDQQVSGQVER